MNDIKHADKKTDSHPLDRGGNSALSSQLGSQAHQRYIKAATTDNTRRAYQSAIRHFERWGGALPSNPKTVMGYLLVHAQSLSTRTLSLRLTALKNWHELQGFDNPVTDEVKKLLKGIEREEGKPKQKAAVFTIKELQRMIEHIDDDLKGRRDKALILVGFFGAFRRSELVGVTVENIQTVEEGIVITVPRSKTDQEGEGTEKPLLAINSLLCPIAALNTWMYESAIEEGPVFKAINRWGGLQEKRLSPGSVNLILKDRASRAGLAIAPSLSAHSLRRSLATTAFKAGSSFSAIKRQGNWKSDSTVWGYIEEAKMFEDNVMSALVGEGA